MSASNLTIVVISNNYSISGDVTNLVDVTTNVQSDFAGQLLGSASVVYTNLALLITTNSALTTVTSSTLVTNTSFAVTSLNTNLGALPGAFPLRLIVFTDGTNCSLLQRVYYGLAPGTNVVVATTESALDPAQLGTARRISAVHMPWTAANNPIPISGQLALGGTLTATFGQDYADQAANPFLHTYHPDHNNLDLSQNPPRELPVGSQSFSISRTMTLFVAPNTMDFLTLTSGNTSLSGSYTETVTLTGLGGATRTFNSAGTFSLVRISQIATLTTH